jgi:hypothetical protein
MMLTEAFAELPDPRTGPAQRHNLAEMILMALCAVLCGADSRVDCAEWAEDNEAWLKPYLVLEHGTPSHDTFGCCEGLPDITLDAGSFAALRLPARRVFITENEANFLAFPPAAEAIVVFGAGYGWEPLARAKWLHRCQLHYWGEEPEPARHVLARLTPEEVAVYDDLRFDRRQPRLRLEQERVGFGWLCDRLACLPSEALVAPLPCS